MANGNSDARFMGRLWTCAKTAVGMALATGSAALIAHEIKVLSAVALLHLQSAILVAATTASLALWMRVLGGSNPVVKGAVVGCHLGVVGIIVFALVETETYEGLGW